jgi:Circularly permutated YpsA SLOG family
VSAQHKLELDQLTIVSGGQTGADRAALDWALTHGVNCGGWCPKSRLAEDGPIDPKYPLKETPSESYSERTEWNVRDSDATVIFSIAPELTGGSKETLEFARQHHKPCLHLHSRLPDGAGQLRTFLEKNNVQVLNVAGPRSSHEPAVGQFVRRLLSETLEDRGADDAAL